MSVLPSVRSSVSKEQLGSHWTDFHGILYLNVFRKSVEKSNFSLKSDKNNGYFTRRSPDFLIISHSVLLRMRNVSDKCCRENQNSHFWLKNAFLFKNRAVYEIMWKHISKRGRPQMAVWRMRIGYRIPKVTHTLTVCNIYCFPTATVVVRTRHYTHIACLVLM
jgi:hypothetical protein